MALEAFVFDAYGTLYDVHSVIKRCESCWPGKGMQLSLAWRAKQLEYTWLRSLMQRYAPFSAVTREALEHSCEAMGLPLDRARAQSLMDEYLDLRAYPDVAPALNALKAKKAILSNGSPDMLWPLVRNSGLKLDAVLSVDEVKVFKPDPRVYELAVKKLGITAKNIGFVSSNCWDALGAKSFGFTVFWINRSNAPVDRLGLQPDKIVKSLDEVSP
jgi:2-haloacid dehalogenase